MLLYSNFCLHLTSSVLLVNPKHLLVVYYSTVQYMVCGRSRFRSAERGKEATVTREIYGRYH